MKATLTLIILLCLTAAGAHADWKPWEPFVGAWRGKGTTALGRYDAAVTWKKDLGGRILVRRNVTRYEGRPSHEDLLIVRADGTLADYYDNEGHVIHYACTVDGSRVVCTSTDPGPCFRLTMEPRGQDRYGTRFEIASPGTDEFKVYVEGDLTR